jgi:NADH-quinone oxidoreductase subunit M
MLEQIVRYFDTTVLSWLLALPVLGALGLLLLPRRSPRARVVAVGVMLLEFVLSLHLLRGDYSTAGYRYLESHPLVPNMGIAYTVGIDGISLWLVLLTTFITPIALCSSWSTITTKVREFAICFLLLETAVLGSFVVLDLFLFYIFWELALAPMYLIIGIWGGRDRIYASFKFVLYTMAGSLLMLVAIVYVASAYHDATSLYTLDIRQLTPLMLDADTQLILFLAFALAFAIKIPLVPFHSWVPYAYVQAPTSGTVMLSAVLLKMGTYGFIRFAMPLFPLASHRVAPSLCVLAVIGIIYGAYCAWVQRDVKKLVAYSSISHLGFVMLGVFSMTPQGVGGAVLQMVNHGISTGALFLLVGIIHERKSTLDELGGLAKVMPAFALLFVVLSLSSIGVPGTNGFVGEFMILNGTFLSRNLPTPFFFTAAAALGMIFSAVYMLRAVMQILWGPTDARAQAEGGDLARRDLATLLPLAALVVVIGVVPSLFLNKTKPSVEAFLRAYDIKLHDSVADADGLASEPYLACVSPPSEALSPWQDTDAHAAAIATPSKPGPRCSAKPRTRSPR